MWGCCNIFFPLVWLLADYSLICCCRLSPTKATVGVSAGIVLLTHLCAWCNMWEILVSIERVSYPAAFFCYYFSWWVIICFGEGFLFVWTFNEPLLRRIYRPDYCVLVYQEKSHHHWCWMPDPFTVSVATALDIAAKANGKQQTDTGRFPGKCAFYVIRLSMQAPGSSFFFLRKKTIR